jgi:hypothetical protein
VPRLHDDPDEIEQGVDRRGTDHTKTQDYLKRAYFPRLSIFSGKEVAQCI